ncbi:phosphoenolpyruvate-protein phosphotransferase [Beutenbergia cavernae DSM 12333]|uniref:Phosphoenolpyruvate-protein phosphotransferase n=1 Tax=Beutenbergia cavernae (strain ATCC BAA-8 / DSM 12333 / CCUG 43141 / JCM 11478 / NBRC 16432 / NCIMB 13614 / HKI 0122) TaxID=471853 RepID=C5BXJ8_BEUC1|nr:phosphoenolpyruvate-protein phosphotransferase [Beutenbergia cavernae DSM 12333]
MADADRDAAADSIAVAAEAVSDELRRAGQTVSGTGKEILETTAQMATDPALVGPAQAKVRDEGLAPARAVWEAASDVAATFASIGGYLAGRVRDVEDVRDRIIAELTGAGMPGVPLRAEPFVLLADDLAPADTALLDPEHVRAILTRGGGPTSHTAILARSLGIPAVVALGRAAQVLRDGVDVLVDGTSGVVVVDPDAAGRASVRPRRAARPFDGVGRTSDGHRVELLANVGDAATARDAAAAGAEGVGLFRTEFAFANAEVEPSLEAQVAAYLPVFASFAGRKVVIRTLDAGADKPLPFLTGESEANPALGVRGLRTSWEHPDVLDRQLAAIAAAAGRAEADVWVMAPMVATVEETDAFVAACARHGLERAGVMVEIPAAALLAGPILARASFASLGTNDLVQYTMAADRMLGDVARLTTAWQPAVLRLVEATCLGGAQQARPVGVCGEAAADPALACVLLGLGASSLSMGSRALGDVAAALARTSLDECRRLARIATDAESAEAARALVLAEVDWADELG